MGYPVITKDQFYSKFSKDTYKYINNSYRESDNSVRVYKDEILRNKTLIFQLPDLNKEEVPDNRKNLYKLLEEDHIKFKEDFTDSNIGYKKISAALLVKFIDPYIMWDSVISNDKLTKEYINEISLDFNFDPFISKAFEHLANSVINSDNEYKNLIKAKEFIDKRINYLKKRI
jgi:hypothetical protein